MTLPGYRTGGTHPQAAALRNMLTFYGTRAPHTGRPYSEAMVFGITGGIGLANLSAGMATFDNPIAREHGFASAAAPRLEAPLTAPTATAPGDALTALDTMLAGGHAGFVTVSRAALPHQVAHEGLLGPATYETAICGFEPATGAFEIDDRAPHPWHARRDILAEALETPGGPGPVVVVEPPAEFPALEKSIASGIAACIENMEQPASPSHGLPALEAWAHLARADDHPAGWPVAFPPGAPLFDALTSTYTAIFSTGTGGDALRTLYAEFLEEAGGVTAHNACTEAAAMFRLSARLWAHVAESLLPVQSPLLRQTRSLLNTHRRLFEQQGESVLPGIANTVAELNALRESATADFPLRLTQVEELLHDLGEQLLAVHEVESAAIERLRDATSPT